MMSINAVKGVNIGSGMNSAQLTGEQNSDEISQKGKKLKFNSNNAGGNSWRNFDWPRNNSFLCC